MILAVLLVLALFVIQTLLPGRFRDPVAPGQPGKLAEILGNRDHMRPLTPVGLRAARALANIQEAMPVFLGLALMNLIAGTAAAMATTGALIFLIARVIYVPLYLSGVNALRTLAWVVSWVGLIMMLIPLLERA
ncbi:MAG TPA: MAPEG family protein [Steroidobacteraceae bacterium]|nr:MAPEG family protein [Steroidobacteraceae bacterium]